MKAIICPRYGPPDVLQLADVPKPVPRNNEVLIRIVDTTCHIGDVRVRGVILPALVKIPFRLYMGIRKPRCKILGMELSGVVEAAGKDVRRFRAGDAVLACAGYTFGAYAEYICLPEDAQDCRKGLVVPKPAAMDFAEAAAGLATGGLTALIMLRKAGDLSGKRVMVYGASGSVGMYAVQLARHQGADVTGVSGPGNLDLVRGLGAGKVIDYTSGELENCPDTFDLVFDAVAKLPTAVAKKLSAPDGLRLNVFRHAGPVSAMTTAALQFLADLVEQGKVRTFIDREYPLERIVDAHRYVQQGHKRGHVVIHVGRSQDSD